MNIHEYQAQDLLRQCGMPVLPGKVVASPSDAAAAAREIGFPVVVKAQVHSGGRGKAGGVRVARDEPSVLDAAEAILSLRIQGLPVRKLLVAPAVGIDSEAYLSLLVDRAKSRLVFVACATGGVDIEETARRAPDTILRLEVPVNGDSPAPSRARYEPLSNQLFGNGAAGRAVAEVMASMEQCLRSRDCALVEVNPLAMTREGTVVALDAKITLDDNALFRQPENLALREPESESNEQADRLAREAGLSFVPLDGDIGCMVNGAGLAMATMDTLKYFGGDPANFLDVGGSSNPAKVINAFKIILSNPRVKVVFINIFGGITRCDDVARGLLDTFAQYQVSVPIVVRLAGTNDEAGRALLAADQHLVGSGLVVAATLEEGAEKAVEIARQP
jgi:succinyl-CoA synthetase beta subunit